MATTFTAVLYIIHGSIQPGGDLELWRVGSPRVITHLQLGRHSFFEFVAYYVTTILVLK